MTVRHPVPSWWNPGDESLTSFISQTRVTARFHSHRSDGAAIAAPGDMFLERPLASLPADRATRFLAALAPDLSITDRELFTLGFQQVAARWQDAGGPAVFEPLALFGYRDVDARTGLAYAVTSLATPRGVDLRKTMFLSIAHKARIAGHDRLFVVTPDRALRGTFGSFGMVFPTELQLERYLVGWFELVGRIAQAA